MSKPRYIIIFVFFVEINPLDYEDRSKVSLAQLPLDKLLNVKNSLEYKRVVSFGKNKDYQIELEDDEELAQDQGLSKSPLPLKGDWFTKKNKKKIDNPIRRDGWDEKGGKKGDLAAIFQSTITILAFLAFGGYLLCMICMAIRNNQGMMNVTTTPAPANFIIAGRRRREIDQSPIMNNIFDGLIKLSEGYAKYHTQN